MSNLSRSNPTGRFTGLADSYAKYRPGYPDAALDLIMTHCGLDGDSVLADIGCGTGISSRLFACRGVRVIGIEPNAEMRASAGATPLPAQFPRPTYRDGRAEATGLPDDSVAAVLAAQAFHWFEPEAALREFCRILRPSGWVILMWNERDETDPFTAAYGAVIRTAPEAKAVELPRRRAGEPLLASPLFEDAERVVFHHEQVLDEEGLLGRAFSASYAPQEPSERAAFATALRELFSRYHQGTTVVVRYETSVYLGRRRR
jgi:SAM-dependent methyltransferase